MISPLKRLAAFAVLTALTVLAAAPAQYEYRTGYNPYTGTRANAEAGYNPYTGTRGGVENTYNSYTGTREQTREVYNPYTGRGEEVQRAYNPYTGRTAVRYGYRR
jgi:hypothetical protein